MMPDYNNLKLIHLLLTEANLAENSPLPDDPVQCINILNEYRSEQHWPLASGMSCIQAELVDLVYEGSFDIETERAILQQSLIALFKQQADAHAQVITALKTIQKTCAGHVFALMAENLVQLVDNINSFSQQDAILNCLKQYDLLLKDYQQKKLQPALAEKLFLDIFFYQQQIASEPRWSNEPKTVEHLKRRTQYFAQLLSDLLQAPDNETVLAKEKVMPLYLAVTDGLLFSGNFELRARLEGRLQKLDQLDDPMLLIAVPAQKLWAECKRISVNI